MCIRDRPQYDEELTVLQTIEIPVQINGKVIERIKIERDMEEAKVIELALALEDIKSKTEGKTIVKKIFVPNKILNIVVK